MFEIGKKMMYEITDDSLIGSYSDLTRCSGLKKGKKMCEILGGSCSTLRSQSGNIYREIVRVHCECGTNHGIPKLFFTDLPLKYKTLDEFIKGE